MLLKRISFVTVTSDNFVKETVTKPGDEVKTYEADNEDQEDTVTSIMTALSGSILQIVQIIM